MVQAEGGVIRLAAGLMQEGQLVLDGAMPVRIEPHAGDDAVRAQQLPVRCWQCCEPGWNNRSQWQHAEATRVATRAGRRPASVRRLDSLRWWCAARRASTQPAVSDRRPRSK